MLTATQRWLCPFCDRIAILPTKHPHLICDSKTCICGAIALGAPSKDEDEMMDDATKLFQFEIYPGSELHSEFLHQHLKSKGIEIKQGVHMQVREELDYWRDYCYVWFRQQPSQVFSTQIALVDYRRC